MKSLSTHLKTNEQSARQLLASPSYRQFLETFFQLKKNLSSSYSYAVFAKQADMAKSLPRDIIAGDKRITEKNLPKFLKAMELPGIIEEFFVQLIKLETDPSASLLLEKMATLFLETYFIRTYTDANFQDIRIPFIYAASGDTKTGATLDEMSKRTGLKVEVIEDLMKDLEKVKLGRFVEKDLRFIPSIGQVHIESDTEAQHFLKFYQQCLTLQYQATSKKFDSKEDLFYNEVFSVKVKDMPALKEQLKKAMRSFIMNAENPQGDSVAIVNLGFFKHSFKEL